MSEKMTLKQKLFMWAMRRSSYRACFLGKNNMLTEDAMNVIADLKKFCRADGSSTFQMKDDPHGRVQALLEGRREVFERIMLYINMPESQIRELKEIVREQEVL